MGPVVDTRERFVGIGRCADLPVPYVSTSPNALI
jgi:hypothetical protein